MDSTTPSPGPDADRAFETGIRVAAVAALGCLTLLSWAGFVSIRFAAFLLVVLFPVYLLVVASVLSTWLGFDKGAVDLRPVRRENGDQSLWGNEPR